VRRRARTEPDSPGEQVGGQDRGTWYYRNLGLHIFNYGQGAHEGFDGEADFALNAVDLTTVHRAKGLEWPVVFVPSMTSGRFPATRTGRQQDWLVPRERFAAARYEGSDSDERRLFYVAMTRARNWLSVSRHAKVKTRGASASPYYRELDHLEADPKDIRPPAVSAPTGASDHDPIALTYSELPQFLDCGMAFRLRNRMSFQPRLAPELGYGKAVHHVLRAVAEVTKATGQVPNRSSWMPSWMPSSSCPPSASRPTASSRTPLAASSPPTPPSTRTICTACGEVERPFELHLDEVVVTGRADVILDQEGGVPTALPNVCGGICGDRRPTEAVGAALAGHRLVLSYHVKRSLLS